MTLPIEALKVTQNSTEMMWLLHDRAMKADGNILEVGTHVGSSALVFMNAMSLSNSDHMLVTVDPWGMKPYPSSRSKYGDDNQRDAIASLAVAARQFHTKWHHFKMTSLEFLKWADGKHAWYGGKQIPYQWGLAFLDGEHVFDTVHEEIMRVLPNLLPHGGILVDNANHQQPNGISMKVALAEVAIRNELSFNVHGFENDSMVVEMRKL